MTRGYNFQFRHRFSIPFFTPAPSVGYNTPMENEKFNDSIEIKGDLYDEYEAIQAAEADSKPLPPMTEADWQAVYQDKMRQEGDDYGQDYYNE